MPRYSLYRDVHRFIRHRLNQFGELLATTNFQLKSAVTNTGQSFDRLANDLRMHAAKEEKFFTPLFEAKGSTAHMHVSEEHEKQEGFLNEFEELFQRVAAIEDPNECVEIGDNIYDSYNLFVSHNIDHLHEEETKLMSDLWRLYTDEELQAVTLESYRAMPEEILVLGCTAYAPTLDFYGKQTYLGDLKAACSDELLLRIWAEIQPCLTNDEINTFATMFGLSLDEEGTPAVNKQRTEVGSDGRFSSSD